MSKVVESWSRMLPSDQSSNEVVTRVLEHHSDGTWTVSQITWNLNYDSSPQEEWLSNQSEPELCYGYIDEKWTGYSRFDGETSRWKQIGLLA